MSNLKQYYKENERGIKNLKGGMFSVFRTKDPDKEAEIQKKEAENNHIKKAVEQVRKETRFNLWNANVADFNHAAGYCNFSCETPTAVYISETTISNRQVDVVGMHEANHYISEFNYGNVDFIEGATQYLTNRSLNRKIPVYQWQTEKVREAINKVGISDIQFERLYRQKNTPKKRQKLCELEAEFKKAA